nr:hypothetical protein [Tanacetum cinerariifolium]
MFGVNDLDGDEVIVESVYVAKQAKEVFNDITLAKALLDKSAKPKANKVMIQELEHGTTTITPITITTTSLRPKMSRDVLTIGSTMRIPLLYRGEYYQWVERFMNYLEEQTDGKVMINSIKNGDQPLPRVTQVSIARTASTEQPPLKDKSM